MRDFKDPKKPSRPSETFFKPTVQTKLSVGSAGDTYEKEADAMADKVVNKKGGADVQRQAMPGEENVQQKPLAESISSVQLKEMPAEDEPVQKKTEEKDEAAVQKKEEEQEPVQKKETEEEPVQKKEAQEEEPVQKKEEEQEPVQKKETDEEPVQKKEAQEEEPVQKKEEEQEAVQKKETEEEPVQKKEAKEEEAVQKKEEEKEKLQQKEDEEVQKKESGAAAKTAPSVENRLKATKGNGRGLDGSVRGEMERGFGADFSGVKIHTDDTAVGMNQELGAHAFTHGNDIYFNSSKYDPGSVQGKVLLAHELTHTIQQGAATEQASPVASDNSALESDANESTVGVMRKLMEGGRSMGEKIMPKLRSGLRISRCQPDSKTEQQGKELEGSAAGEKTDGGSPAQKLTEYQQWKKDNDPKVKNVKSLEVAELEKQKTSADTALSDRKLKRISDIDKQIKVIEDYMATMKSPRQVDKDRVAALKADKLKTDEELKTTKDCKDANDDRRLKVVEAMKTVTVTNKLLADAKKNWAQYDDKFTGSEELMKVLNEIKMTPADLKALVGQESGDLNNGNDTEGDIAGIAQISEAATKDAGHKPEERKDPNKAILISAKVLRNVIGAAGISSSEFSDQKDYKSMAFAAYNAGGNAIAKSRAAAVKQKKSKISWSALITGDSKSPLYAGLLETYADKKVPDKFTEVKNYVTRIFLRLGQ